MRENKGKFEYCAVSSAQSDLQLTPGKPFELLNIISISLADIS